ncbi:T9SS type A sorting domain-containing protein [Fibrella aquatica]|uniref:T9SS type A sorting domain-containing protein n=1 Tax=Fibrella aquatica TaxID=3242487 RepID=UPI003520F9A5
MLQSATISKRILSQLAPLFLLLCTSYTVAHSQNIATWSFGTTGVGPTPVALNILASNAVYTNAGATTAISSSRFNCSQWTNTGLDLNRYLEISVTPAASYSATITEFNINVENNNTTTILSGPSGFEIRSSTDGFVSSYTSLSIGTVTETPTNIIVPVTGYGPSTATYTVRIYFWGATDPARLIRIGSVGLKGTVQSPALPVSLISFQGRAMVNAVQLNWATAWEQSASQFVVQRSRDAAEFAEVGTLPASGTTNRQRTYTLTDSQPTEGTNYYRLKQVDLDGSVNYSKIIAVTVYADQPSVRVYPNPTDGRYLQVQLSNLTTPTATIQTLTGQQIQGKWLEMTASNAVWQPNTPLSPGIYLFDVRDGGIGQRVKVLVQ